MLCHGGNIDPMETCCAMVVTLSCRHMKGEGGWITYFAPYHFRYKNDRLLRLHLAEANAVGFWDGKGDGTQTETVYRFNEKRKHRTERWYDVGVGTLVVPEREQGRRWKKVRETKRGAGFIMGRTNKF